MDFFGPLVSLVGLIAFIFAAALLCHWLLEPVNRAAGHLNAPTRFLLTDFIWLMMQLQVVLAVVMNTIAEAMPQRGLLIVLGLVCLPVLVLWGASVSVVSRAGIQQPLRRAVVILLLVPGSLAEVMALPLLVVGGIVFVSNHPLWAWDHRWTNDVVSRLVIVGMVALAIAAAAVVLRRLSFWVLTAPLTPASAKT
jgi:hypothetical protein